MDQAKMKVAYVITERGERSYWNRIGAAFTNKDGSITVKLDAVPMSGTLQIRDYEPREDFDGAGQGSRGRRMAPPARLEAEQPV